ncbi:MAG: sulfatase [Chloroflexota bacterium]
MGVHRRGLVAGVAAAGIRAAFASAAPPRRPDIVVILADDMRTSDWRALPKTRRRLRDAAFYPNFFFNTPLCDPSRAAFLTGQYGHNNGVLWNMRDGPDSTYSVYRRNGLARRSIPYVLRKAGYRTGLFGKFLNSGQTIGNRPAGWDRWVSTPVIDYDIYPLDIEGKLVMFRKGDYLTDVLGEFAREFVLETPAEQPLFLLFGSNAPHTGPGNSPPVPAPRHRSAFPGAAMARTPAFNEADVSDKSSYVRTMLPMQPEAIAYGDRLERSRLQSLLSLDEAIVSLVDTLEETGRLESTSIFIASDNGFQMGEHRLMDQKAVPYDGSLRVPMLAWGPRFRRGTSSRLVANVDLAPTIAELAGVRMPWADGASMLSGRPRREVLSQFSPWDPWPVRGWGLHTARYSYFEYAAGEREYFDMRSDPLQLTNLLPPAGVAAPPRAGDLPDPAALSARLAALKGCRGATCR